MTDHDQLEKLAVDAVVAAAKVCETVRRSLEASDAQAKADTSPVTVADFASQAIIVKHLTSSGLPVVAEESAAEFRAASDDLRRRAADVAGLSEAEILDLLGDGMAEPEQRCWVLDLLDGTKGFLRGGHYVVALGLLEEGQPTLGVLGCPRWDIGRLFIGSATGATTATLDRPEWQQPITAVGVNDIPRLTTSVDHSDETMTQKVAKALGATEEPLRMESQAKYAAVASGEADVYLRLSPDADYVETIWDHVAGVAVVEAAGGHVSDVDGKPLDFSVGRRLSNNRGLVVTGNAERLHDRVLSAI
jgi:3'(2'), 5'-bisphosphate nucleotidase